MKKRVFIISIIILIFASLIAGYFIYNTSYNKDIEENNQNDNVEENNQNDNIGNSENENLPNINQDTAQDNNENQIQFNYFVEALEATATITLIKTGIVPNFTMVYNEQPYKYECEEKKVNNNGTVYLKNCKVGEEYFSYGENLEENQESTKFSKLYVLKNNDNDGYFVYDELFYENIENNKDLLKNLLYVYKCKSKFCTYKFYDDKIFISDINLYYKDLENKDTKLEVLSPTKTYNPDKFNINRNFLFEYYKLDNYDIYRTITYASNTFHTPIISIDKEGYGIMVKEYYSNGGYWYLSFNNKTLDNGYYLYASINDEVNTQNNKKYIFDFFTDKEIGIFKDVNDEYFYSNNNKYFVGKYELNKESYQTEFKKVELNDNNLIIRDK